MTTVNNFVFGGQPVIDPSPIYAALTAQHVPTDHWWGKANSYKCPLGIQPGTGLLLMRQGDLDELDINSPYDLTLTCIYDDGVRSEVTLKNLYIDRITNLAPTVPDELQNMRLVSIVDKRALAMQIPLDKAYNLRAYPGGDMQWSSSLNGGVAWTWSTLVQNIWTTNGLLGTWPGLGFTADEPPENWEFWQTSSLEALGLVLDKLNSKLRWNPVTDVFDIVVVGSDDDDLAEALADWRHLQVWDEETSESSIINFPEKVRVLFPRHPREFHESLWYAVDVADTDPVTGTQVGTRILLHDDLPAVYNCSGTLTNSAALATRAAERSADYFLSLHQGSDYQVKIFHGAFSAFVPGSQVEAVIWEDRGLGTRTTVYLSKNNLPKGELPYTEFDRKARLVRVTSGPDGNGYYTGQIQCHTPTSGWTGIETIYVREGGL